MSLRGDRLGGRRDTDPGPVIAASASSILSSEGPPVWKEVWLNCWPFWRVRLPFGRAVEREAVSMRVFGSCRARAGVCTRYGARRHGGGVTKSRSHRLRSTVVSLAIGVGDQ